MNLINVRHVPDLDAYVIDMPGSGGVGVRVILNPDQASRLAAGLKVAMAREVQPSPSPRRRAK